MRQPTLHLAFCYTAGFSVRQGLRKKSSILAEKEVIFTARWGGGKPCFNWTENIGKVYVTRIPYHPLHNIIQHQHIYIYQPTSICQSCSAILNYALAYWWADDLNGTGVPYAVRGDYIPCGGLPPAAAAQQFNCLLSTVVYTTSFLVRMADQMLVSPGESQPGGRNTFALQFYCICTKAWTWYGASALPFKVLITSKPWLWLMDNYSWHLNGQTINDLSKVSTQHAPNTHKTVSWDPQARLPPSRRPKCPAVQELWSEYHWRNFPKAKKKVIGS